MEPLSFEKLTDRFLIGKSGLEIGKYYREMLKFEDFGVGYVDFLNHKGLIKVNW